MPSNVNYELCKTSMTSCLKDAFENIPPFLPSQGSKVDVQRAQGTGVTFVIPPVSLPFLASNTHVFSMGANGNQNGRVTGGIFDVPTVRQMPCT